MKNYLQNKQPKDPNFLKIFRNVFNTDRKLNAFSHDEASHELGLAWGTLDQKLKPSGESDITVSEWSHHLEITGNFETLNYFVNKHGFELKSLNLDMSCAVDVNIDNQADKAMMEVNEAWAAVKLGWADKKWTKKELANANKELDEGIHALQQLKHDINCEGVEND